MVVYKEVFVSGKRELGVIFRATTSSRQVALHTDVRLTLLDQNLLPNSNPLQTNFSNRPLRSYMR